MMLVHVDIKNEIKSSHQSFFLLLSILNKVQIQVFEKIKTKLSLNPKPTPFFHRALSSDSFPPTIVVKSPNFFFELSRGYKASKIDWCLALKETLCSSKSLKNTDFYPPTPTPPQNLYFLCCWMWYVLCLNSFCQ